jgi:AbrB family looped-hinge helix DNA binding protein
MGTTIDAAGRIVIPKKLREQAGLLPGMELEVRCRDGRIEIEPAEVPYHLERHGRLLVAVPNKPAPPVTVEMVNDLIEQMRAERERRTLGLDTPEQ